MSRLASAIAARDAASLAHYEASAPLNPPDEATGLAFWDAEHRVCAIRAEIAAAERRVTDCAESVAIAERYWDSMPRETAALFAADDIDERRAKLAAARQELEAAR